MRCPSYTRVPLIYLKAGKSSDSRVTIIQEMVPNSDSGIAGELRECEQSLAKACIYRIGKSILPQIRLTDTDSIQYIHVYTHFDFPPILQIFNSTALNMTNEKFASEKTRKNGSAKD